MAVLGVQVLDDLVVGRLVSAVDDVDVGLAAQLVADANRVAAALRLNVQEINLEKVRHRFLYGAHRHDARALSARSQMAARYCLCAWTIGLLQ
ncbi:hypothetical protein ACVWYQ_003547 [Bradyrhizobium sp. USDA 3397]